MQKYGFGTKGTDPRPNRKVPRNSIRLETNKETYVRLDISTSKQIAGRLEGGAYVQSRK